MAPLAKKVPKPLYSEIGSELWQDNTSQKNTFYQFVIYTWKNCS